MLPEVIPAQETIRDLYFWSVQELQVLGAGEAVANTEQLLEVVFHWSRTDLYLSLEGLAAADLAEIFRNFVSRRRHREPLAYILGEIDFWNETLSVRPGCLIPRPETEILIEKFLENSGFAKQADFQFLDLGSGSGAIGVALLREYPNAHAVCSDISDAALSITRENYKRYDLITRAEILKSDLFENLEGRKFQAILSNPPYIGKKEWSELEPELSFEPQLALAGGLDGLDFYRRIIAEAGEHLRPGGWLVLEMGKEQAAEIRQMIEKTATYQDVLIFKDYQAIDRVLMARKSF